MIDMRSDAVTLPTARMREAMYTAELGDDTAGEDPTVNRLQEMAADRLGKEAGLFVASGTMANLTALLTLCSRGDEVIMGDRSYMFMNGGGAASSLGGIHVRTVPDEQNGAPEPEHVSRAIRTNSGGYPRSQLLCLENTHNRCGGAAPTAAQMDALAAVAHTHGLQVYLDGARIFNAEVALAVPARVLATGADMVAFCLSKGLSAPAGSVLCGSAQAIGQARRYRQLLGGAMRQAGVLAAAGIVAMQEMVDRISEDHANARVLAEGIADIPGLSIDPVTVATNIVLFELSDARWTPVSFAQAMRQSGVGVLPFGERHVRAMTHHGIERRHVEQAIVRMRRTMAANL